MYAMCFIYTYVTKYNCNLYVSIDTWMCGENWYHEGSLLTHIPVLKDGHPLCSIHFVCVA